MLVKVGIGVFIGVTLFFSYALCKAAGDADDAMGTRDYEEDM